VAACCRSIQQSRQQQQAAAPPKSAHHQSSHGRRLSQHATFVSDQYLVLCIRIRSRSLHVVYTGDYSPCAVFSFTLFASDTTIDARAAVPPKVSIANQVPAVIQRATELDDLVPLNRARLLAILSYLSPRTIDHSTEAIRISAPPVFALAACCHSIQQSTLQQQSHQNCPSPIKDSGC
jgi:hypothetical protein